MPHQTVGNQHEGQQQDSGELLLFHDLLPISLVPSDDYS
jgi:hypothetical protein